MAIQVQASVNAGAYAAGKSVVVASDAFQLRLNPQFIAEVWSVRWEIYEAPTGFTTPAGWTADANGLSWYYVATSTTALMPPLVTLGSLWGKYLIRATANAGVLGGVVTTDAVDETCCLVMLSPEGVENIAALEADQSDPRGALAIVKIAIETLVPSNGFETYNVLLYGADPTGVADSTAAIQAAIDAAEAAGGGEVFLPPGTYLKPGSSPKLTPKSNVTLRGIHGVSILQLDATGTNALLRRDVGTFDNFSLVDLVLDGGRTAALYSEYGENSESFYGTNIRVIGCIVRNSRVMGLGFQDCEDVYVEGCTFENLNRDGLYCWRTRNVRVENCDFRYVNDDSVSCSASPTPTMTEPVRYSVSINNCRFFRCQGPDIVGAKIVHVTNCRMHQMMSYGLFVSHRAAGPGFTIPHDVLIEGNIITDVFLRQEFPAINTSQWYIRIGGAPKDAGAGAAPPGDNDTATATIVDLFGTGVGNFYSTDVDLGTNPSAGGYNIVIRGNILARTLPACAAVADWGYDADIIIGSYGTYSGPIPDSALETDGIILERDMVGCLVDGNIIRTTGEYAVRFWGDPDSADIGDMAFRDVVIRNNLIHDFSLAGLYWPTVATTFQRISVIGNDFNGDPRCVNANRSGTAGAWTADTTPVAIRLGYADGKVVSGNTFRNVARITQDSLVTPAVLNEYVDNVQVGIPAVIGFSASNSGCGTFSGGGEQFTTLVEECDLSSADYGETLNTCPRAASSLPVAGYWVQGHVVRNTAPAANVNGILYGWIRLTTGNGNVAGTDWGELIAQWGASATPYASNVRCRSTNSTNAQLEAFGSEANIDVQLTPKGTGAVRFGTVVADATETLAGRISIKDAAGNVVWLATVTPTP